MQWNVAVLEKFSSVVEEGEEHDESLKTSTVEHIQSLRIEFQPHFPESMEEETALVRSPFSS